MRGARRWCERAKRYLRGHRVLAEDAARTELDFLHEVVEAAIEAGATTLNIPDTVGYAVPDEYARLIAGIKKNVRGADKVVLSTHTHDDLGLAVANAWPALKDGARQVECTINGIGERAGNSSLEEIVMALQTRPIIFNLTTGINTQPARADQPQAGARHRPGVQRNKAIVGQNAFAHEAGIHQDGMLKHAAPTRS